MFGTHHEEEAPVVAAEGDAACEAGEENQAAGQHQGVGGERVGGGGQQGHELVLVHDAPNAHAQHNQTGQLWERTHDNEDCDNKITKTTTPENDTLARMQHWKREGSTKINYQVVDLWVGQLIISAVNSSWWLIVDLINELKECYVSMIENVLLCIEHDVWMNCFVKRVRRIMKIIFKNC